MRKQGRTTKTIHLLVVEQSRLLRECLSARLSAAGAEVTAVDADGAVAAARRCQAPVVLLSARLPSQRTVKAAHGIRRASPASRLIFLDEIPRPAVLAAALEIPVDGYWSQHTGFDDLLDAVFRSADGQWVCCPVVAECLEPGSDGPSFVGWPDGSPLAGLSRRERQTLVKLAQGLSVKEIAGQLELSANTVDNHKAHMMHKLGLHKSADAVRLAIREGLVEE